MTTHFLCKLFRLRHQYLCYSVLTKNLRFVAEFAVNPLL